MKIKNTTLYLNKKNKMWDVVEPMKRAIDYVLDNIFKDKATTKDIDELFAFLQRQLTYLYFVWKEEDKNE